MNFRCTPYIYNNYEKESIKSRKYINNFFSWLFYIETGQNMGFFFFLSIDILKLKNACKNMHQRFLSGNLWCPPDLVPCFLFYCVSSRDSCAFSFFLCPITTRDSRLVSHEASVFWNFTVSHACNFEELGPIHETTLKRRKVKADAKSALQSADTNARILHAWWSPAFMHLKFIPTSMKMSCT